jgi:predicted TIM-barrel fold metal-dependent hydrolase
MVATHPSKSAEIRARLNHPVIDVDGHLSELAPLLDGYVLDYAQKLGGAKAVERFRRAGELSYGGQVANQWMQLSEAERRDKWIPIPAWWGAPTGNTRDRATAHLPRLLHERMDELGIDFSVLYPSSGLAIPWSHDDELRQIGCRAWNHLHADLFRDLADRLTVAAMIPMHTPEEAISELEFVVGTLGMKAIVLVPVNRPIAFALRAAPELAYAASRPDTFGIDSEFDYDPFWAKCVELNVAVGTHGSGIGTGSRRSISRYVYNHIGGCASGGERLAKSLFLGGVTRRFPTLKFAFLEGGVGWACQLYADLIGHWEKRNRDAIRANLDPASLDLAGLMRYVDAYDQEYAPGRHISDKRAQIGALFADPGAHPEELDDFAACGITKAKDIKGLFVPNFYFGCEADDPINAWAFNARVNPFGARLKAVFGSDIAHWDVPDMSEVLEEAHELVEHGLLTEADFRDFVFTYPAQLYAGMNPDFFKGTKVEAEVARSGLLSADSGSGLNG